MTIWIDKSDENNPIIYMPMFKWEFNNVTKKLELWVTDGDGLWGKYFDFDLCQMQDLKEIVDFNISQIKKEVKDE